MGELNVRDAGTDEATGGSSLQGRLRSALLTRGWNRGPEPRVRFGQTLLPGLACLGPAERAAGAACLAEADALREGHLTLLGRVTPCRGEIDWAGREATPSWRVALHGLEHLIPAGFAAVLAESPEERATWWALVATHLQDWLTRGRRGHGAAARLEAQTRRVTNLIQLATIFPDELQADPDLRRAPGKRSTPSDVLAVTLPRHPADVNGRGRARAARRGTLDGEAAKLDGPPAILWRQLRELVHDDGGRDRARRGMLVLAGTSSCSRRCGRTSRRYPRGSASGCA